MYFNLFISPFLKCHSKDNFIYSWHFFVQNFKPTLIIYRCTWTFSYFQEIYLPLVRRIKPFFIIVTSCQKRSTCLCGYVHLLMFGYGWRSKCHCFWSLTWLHNVMSLSLQGVMWTNQELFSEATILCAISRENIWQHFCKSCPEPHFDHKHGIQPENLMSWSY